MIKKLILFKKYGVLLRKRQLFHLYTITPNSNVDSREVLKRYLQENPGLEHLFPNKTGGHITTRSLQFVIEKYRKLIGIEHLNAHSLRHSFCHELVSRKIPLDVVARLAGHVKNDGTPNIQQTLTYTQPGEDDLQRTIDEISWH